MPRPSTFETRRAWVPDWDAWGYSVYEIVGRGKSPTEYQRRGPFRTLAEATKAQNELAALNATKGPERRIEEITTSRLDELEAGTKGVTK